jgi:hypothetical protein
MSWDDYIALGRSLSRHWSEASKRSAVSRAYYGAFNLSRRWLEMNVASIDNRGAHESVWRTFRKAERAGVGNRSDWERVGALGSALRTLRNRADYADEFPDLARESLAAVGIAERIVRLLAELEAAD